MYSERASMLPHVTAWENVTGPGGGPRRILPDGCLDIIWHAGRVFVAGPDTTAQLGTAPPGRRFCALRFGCGTGPGVLGLPASELVDRQVPLDALWPAAEVRRLAEADDPPAALEAAAAARWRDPDPAMIALARAARAGTPVGAFADRAGLSARQLRRRVTTAYGYGPKTLHRVFRFQRAVALARAGRPFAAVAADAGYADQAHLAREARTLAGVPLTELLTGRAQPGSPSHANRST
jgi:AraC-like DNA-binding protein